MGQVGESKGTVCLTKFLSGQAVLVVTEAHATIFFFNSDSKESHVAHSAPHVLGEHVFFIHRLTEGFDLFISKLFEAGTKIVAHLVELENVIEVTLGCEGSNHAGLEGARHSSASRFQKVVHHFDLLD